MYIKEQIMPEPKDIRSKRRFGPIITEVELHDDITNALIKMTDTLIEDKKTKSFGKHLAGVIDKELIIHKEDLYEAGCDDFFERCVQNYVIECIAKKMYDQGLNFNTDDYDITSSINACWVVSQYENEYNPIHDHVGCNISAVLYLKVPDYKDRRKIDSKVDKQDHDGDINFVYNITPSDSLETGVVKFTAKPGFLIIFPSNLLHSVYPFIGEGERRSISFNAVYTANTFNKETRERKYFSGNQLYPIHTQYTSKKQKKIEKKYNV